MSKIFKKRNWGKSTRTTMFEFQEAQIEGLRKQNKEYYDLIIDLKTNNNELRKIIIDLVDKKCTKSFIESAKAFATDAD